MASCRQCGAPISATSSKTYCRYACRRAGRRANTKATRTATRERGIALTSFPLTFDADEHDQEVCEFASMLDDYEHQPTLAGYFGFALRLAVPPALQP